MTAPADGRATPVTVPDGPAVRGGTRESWQGSGRVTQVLVLTRRALWSQFADRRVLVIKLVQPLLLLVVLGQLFGSMVDPGLLPSGVPYMEFLLPALLVTSGIGSAAASGAILSRDMENGMTARLRSLPIALSSVLFARCCADVARCCVQMVIMVVCAWALFGYSPPGGVPGTAAALALAAFVIWALTWVFLALSCWLRSLDAMQSIAGVATFPLMFGSSAFAPVDGMPFWLQLIARANPLSYAVDAARGLCLGTPDAAGLLGALAASTGVAAVGILLAVRGFRRPLVG
ncbi:ABC transporter permease [Streptomyces purpurascens]|uniref:Transport permease protein n=1 Tax=Streptomyces purpurascens TaxID=1924 RepID=A0ABZ1MNC2_STREF|nr:ABC transporter permease [Streptomyces purpurascens]MCE7049091.1 ABC transporter permease [Streptomyces purpurascens]